MLKNPNYVFGSFDYNLPVKINTGEYLLKKLLENKNNRLTNAQTNQYLTFGDIAQQVMNFATSLSLRGVKRGQIVAICSENILEYWPAVIGVLCTGATVSPMSWAYGSGEFKHILNISKPKYLICSSMVFEKQRALLRDFKFRAIVLLGAKATTGTLLYEDLAKVTGKGLEKNVAYENFQVPDVLGQTDNACILYSSGTTGLPKGVMLTHVNMLIGIICYYEVHSEPSGITLTVTPWTHTMSLLFGLATFSYGRDVVYLPRFDVEQYLDCIDKYKITQLLVAPPILVAISKTPSQRDLSSVKIITSGAAPLQKDTVEDVLKRFPRAKLLQGYGLSEVSQAIIRDNDPDKAKAGGIGFVTECTVIKVVDINTRKPLGPKQEGEICVKGPRVMKGYLNKDKREDFDEEGFFKTGDIGYYDDDKYFFIVDRLKELIKFKGYQVPPAEIEGVLLQHDAVQDAGVIGIPNKEAGEVPLAFVVVQPGAEVTQKELQEFVAERLSSQKRLRGGVRFIKEIPKNPSGKILRKVLRNIAKSGKSKL